MSGKPKPPRSDRFWSRLILFGIFFCIFMTWVEYGRARGGNQRSWSYVLEWPVLGGITIWMVWRVNQERKNPTIREPEQDDPNDAGLREWRAYVNREQGSKIDPPATNQDT